MSNQQVETPNSESDSYMMDYSSFDNGVAHHQKSYGRDAKVSVCVRRRSR